MTKKLLFGLALLTIAGCSRADRAARHERKGLDLFAKKDYGRAVLEFRNAAGLAPRDPEPLYRLAMSCLQSKDVKCAVGALRGATGIDPQHVKAQVELAALYLGDGEAKWLRDGEGRIRHVLELAPDNARALELFAATEVRLGKPREAVKVLEAAARRAPEDLIVGTALARARYAAGDISGAGAEVRAGAKRHPQSAPAALAEAEFELATGARGRAAEEMERVLRLDPGNARALAMLAALRNAAGNKTEAEASYRRLSVSDPRSKTAYADFLLSEGKGEAALPELRKLLAANPEDRAIRGKLVATAIALGHLDEAQRTIELALHGNAHDADALLQRGELRLRAGRLAEAEHDFFEVLGYERRSANAHYDLSVVYFRRGNGAMQRNELGQALEIDPGLLPARTALARSLLTSGNAKSALEIMDAAPAGQKSVLDAMVTRNAALMALGQGEAARESVNRALRDSSSPELLLQRAQMDARAKHDGAARGDLERILKDAPDNERALLLLVRTSGLDAMRPYAARSWRARQVLGSALVRAGKPAEGRALLESAASQTPEAYEARVELAEISLREGRAKDAVESLRGVVASHPYHVRARLMLAHANELMGDSKRAEEQYRAVLGMESNNLEALNNLAFLLAKARSNEALSYAQEALAVAPDRAAVLETAAFVYLQKRMYGEAVSHMERARAAEPTPQRTYHLAATYFAAGDAEKGRPMLQAALERDPQIAKIERDWVISGDER